MRRETSRATSSYENKEKHNRNVRPEVSGFLVWFKDDIQQKSTLTM
jgi:hypothetical protein